MAFKYFRCLSCGFNGSISEADIAKHMSRCSTGPTEPVSAPTGYPIPGDLTALWSETNKGFYAICVFDVANNCYTRSTGPELKRLIRRITVLTAALKSAWEEEEPDEPLIMYALQLDPDKEQELIYPKSSVEQDRFEVIQGKCGVCGADHKDWTVHGASLPRRERLKEMAEYRIEGEDGDRTVTEQEFYGETVGHKEEGGWRNCD
jgi:hypothetical protein